MPENCQSFEQCCDGTPFDYQVSRVLPVVDAGPDQISSEETAIMAGATDAPSFVWTQISGPTALIIAPNLLNTTIQRGGTGVIVLRLTGENGCGESFDDVSIDFCSVPEVDAGEDQSLPQNPDPETPTFFNQVGDASNFDTSLWTQISGPPASIANPDSLSTDIFTENEIGEYVFDLAATNACGTSHSQVTLTVTEPPAFNIDVDYVRTLGTNTFGTPASFSLTNQSSYSNSNMLVAIVPPDFFNGTDHAHGTLTITNHGLPGYLNLTIEPTDVYVQIESLGGGVTASAGIKIDGVTVNSVTRSVITFPGVSGSPAVPPNIVIPTGVTVIVFEADVICSSPPIPPGAQSGFGITLTPNPI